MSTKCLYLKYVGLSKAQLNKAPEMLLYPVGRPFCTRGLRHAMRTPTRLRSSETIALLSSSQKQINIVKGAQLAARPYYVYLYKSWGCGGIEF